MTENEAIELIEKDLKLHSKNLSGKYKNGLRMAIQALEEIQQYRAIGTVEEFKHYKHFVHMAELTIDSVEKEKTEIRNKAIDEFAEALLRCDVIDKSVIRRLAEQMKGEQNG